MQAIAKGYHQMREVKVRRLEALETIKSNRARHLEQYQEAARDYNDLLLKEARKVRLHYQRIIDKLMKGDDLNTAIEYTNRNVNISPPSCHVGAYDQAIKMLEMCVDDVISLRSDEFACYIMDDWDWKDSFQRTVSAYKTH